MSEVIGHSCAIEPKPITIIWNVRNKHKDGVDAVGASVVTISVVEEETDQEAEIVRMTYKGENEGQ